MSIAPPQVVEGIDRTPLPYGLLSVLTPRSGADAHWQLGIEWEALGCAPASGIGEPECDTDDMVGLPKFFAPDSGIGEASPFTIYASYECSPVGHTIDYAQEHAMEKLLAREEARAEQAIWTGDLGNNAFITDATNAGSGVVSIVRAIAQLEAWLGQVYGSLGVIHMTREAALVGLAELALVPGSGGRLYTALGTPVVAGAGYPGTGPTGQSPAAGQSYMFATPALLGYRSEPFAGAEPPSAGLDRAHNDLFAVAERTYVVGWDPCGSAYSLANLG